VSISVPLGYRRIAAIVKSEVSIRTIIG